MELNEYSILKTSIVEQKGYVQVGDYLICNDEIV